MMDKKTLVKQFFNHVGLCHQYAIIHHAEDIFEDGKDIDFVISCSSKKELLAVVKDFLNDKDKLYLLNFYKIDFKTYRIDIVYVKEEKFILLELDACILQTQCDLLTVKTKRILKNRTTVQLEGQTFYTATKDDEYDYYINKKAFKKDKTDTFITYIKQIKPELSRKEMESFYKNRSTYFSSVKFKLKYYLNKLALFINRTTTKQRLTIAFLGPDGSGKSTIIDSIKSKNLFRKTKVFHLKPIKTSGKKATENPHESQEYSKMLSLVKLLYFVFQYNTGWFVNILKYRIASSLIIFDRYYYDLLADPKRYRFSGSKRSIKFIGAIIPKPDLTFVLVTDAEIIYKRKQEIAFETLKEQIALYNEMGQLKNTHCIDVNKPVIDISNQIIEIIAKRMHDGF